MQYAVCSMQTYSMLTVILSEAKNLSTRIRPFATLRVTTKAVGRNLVSAYSLLPTPYCFLSTPYSLLPTPYCQRGFSLLEIVIVLAVVGLMAGALTPVALHLIGSKKAFANRDELQALKKAIIGDPLATQWGSEATFGYVGDMGSLPQMLEDLYINPFENPLSPLYGTSPLPNPPYYDFNQSLKTGAGWRGPYVAEKSYSSSTESLQDPYKNIYSYFTTITTDATLGIEVRSTSSDAGLLPDSTDATLGAEVLLTIRSPGPNRTDDGGTQDDLTERVLTTEVLADMAGMIKNSEGAGVPTVSVTINYPVNGILTSSTPFVTEDGVTDSNGDGLVSPLGFYNFNDIPMGERSITLQPGLVYVPGTAYATGSSGSNLSFQVANLSSSSITVSSIRVYCLINPYTYYSSVWIKGEGDSVATQRASLSPRVWTEANTSVSISPSEAVTQSTMQREPYRLILQSSRVEVPDIELNTIGAGEIITVEVRGFYDDNDDIPEPADPVNMAGIPFKIEFSNGSKAIFTPRKQL